MKIYVAAVEALKENERGGQNSEHDETQFSRNKGCISEFHTPECAQFRPIEPKLYLLIDIQTQFVGGPGLLAYTNVAKGPLWSKISN